MQVAGSNPVGLILTVPRIQCLSMAFLTAQIENCAISQVVLPIPAANFLSRRNISISPNDCFLPLLDTLV